MVRVERSLVDRELVERLNEGGAGVAIEHVGTLENIDGILALTEEHP